MDGLQESQFGTINCDLIHKSRDSSNICEMMAFKNKQKNKQFRRAGRYNSSQNVKDLESNSVS